MDGAPGAITHSSTAAVTRRSAWCGTGTHSTVAPAGTRPSAEGAALVVMNGRPDAAAMPAPSTPSCTVCVASVVGLWGWMTEDPSDERLSPWLWRVITLGSTQPHIARVHRHANTATHAHTHKRQPHKAPEQSQHHPFPQRTRPRRLRRDPRGTHGKWSDPSAVATAVRWPRSRTPEAPSRGAPQLPPPEACGVVMAQPPRPVCQPSLQPPPGATEQRQGLEPARTWLE